MCMRNLTKLVAPLDILGDIGSPIGMDLLYRKVFTRDRVEDVPHPPWTIGRRRLPIWPEGEPLELEPRRSFQPSAWPPGRWWPGFSVRLQRTRPLLSCSSSRPPHQDGSSWPGGGSWPGTSGLRIGVPSRHPHFRPPDSSLQLTVPERLHSRGVLPNAPVKARWVTCDDPSVQPLALDEPGLLAELLVGGMAEIASVPA